MKAKLVPALVGACTLAVQAHEIETRIEPAQAVVITLSYANGQPFAYEKYTLIPAGSPTPLQVGQTDAAGRIVFIPGQHEKWRVQATSGDGHGVTLEFATPNKTAAAAIPVASTPRWLLAAFGLSLIFGVFGLIQLLRKK